METEGSANAQSEGHIARTSKYIAFALLFSYMVLLMLVGIAAFFKTSPNDEVWLDLFKSGFLILGGGLTTIIGYYFGSRGTQEAEQSSAIARQQAESARAALVGLAPTSEEDSLSMDLDDIPEEL